METYKICSGGVKSTTDVTLTQLGGYREEIVNGGDCDRTTIYVNFQFDLTSGADEDLSIGYSYEWRVSYEGVSYTDWVTETANVIMPAGEISKIIEVKSDESWCCTGDGAPLL